MNRALLDAINSSGASGVLVSTSSKNPRKLVVQSGSDLFEIWAYVWTLTHGGGAARPVDEYRIQLTGVQPPFEMNPNGPTILIGYQANIQCFAGFDMSKHTHFSSHSPSIQISINVLNEALQDGFAFAQKGNAEIAIGFRTDQFLAYALNAEDLHSKGTDVEMVGLLAKAASLKTISPVEINQLPSDRQKIIRTIAHLSRDASFRKKVTTAYDQRCAVTRMQLRLVDAAHILPVGAKDSNDEVNNGLCLSPTYHRAYDRGLIYLDESFVMRINQAQVAEVTHLNLDGGLEDFKAYLDKKIYLPPDNNQRPSTLLIRKANAHRHIA